jgi:hypothetical protein
MPRSFPTVAQQRKLRAAMLLASHRERLASNGCDEATVVAFTTARIVKVRGY